MSNEKSVIASLANDAGMEKAAYVAALKATCVPANITDAQFAAFCMVAKEYGLNPLTKQIFAFPSRGGVVPVVSVDGWAHVINGNPQMDGVQFEDIREDGKLVAIRCKIYRKDRAHPVECIEYMDECKRQTDVWKQWPARMLRHKSLIQCARYAFGLSGIYDLDEAERIEMVDVTPPKKRAFARVADRNQWMAKTQLRFEEAETIEEVEAINKEIEPTMDLIGVGSGEDGMAWAKIDAAYMMAKARVEAAAEAQLLRQADEGNFDVIIGEN